MLTRMILSGKHPSKICIEIVDKYEHLGFSSSSINRITTDSLPKHISIISRSILLKNYVMENNIFRATIL